jgi:hypothetical protein
MQGEVLIKKAGSNNLIEAEVKASLEVSDSIKTGANSNVSIIFFDGSVVELKSDTQVEIKELVKGKTTGIRLKQDIGETLSKVEKLVDPASRYEVETPVAVAGVRGSQMIVRVIADGTTTVGNIEGSISVTAQGEEVIIPVGQHSVVLPGDKPGQPTEGTTSLIVSAQTYVDSTGDMFDSQRAAAAGPDYLDIQTSQLSFIDGKWILRMGLKSILPASDTVTANTLIEWDFLLDFDRDSTTGLNRPFISNDIGYDYLVQLSLENNAYSCHLRDIAEGTTETIAYSISDKNVEIVIPLTSNGVKSIASPPPLDWIATTIYYKDEDPRNQPSFTDKAPNDGHYVFAPNQTAYSAFDDFSKDLVNPNGVWSYGWMPTDFSVFHAFKSHTTSAFNRYSPPGLVCWYDTLGSDRTPCIWLNSGDTAYGAPKGWLSLHPGPGREPAVIRWTAPDPGQIHVAGEFLAGDRASLTVAIQHNGLQIWTAADAGNFDLLETVKAGDTLDFLVYGAYNYGNTPCSVTISY